MKHLYLILISVLFFGACSPYGYVNQMPVEPMFTEKSEGKVNVAGGFNHGEIQGAYSLNNHIGISTNQYFGETKGYTANLHLYHQVYRSFYIGLQGGFGENKLKYNNTKPYRKVHTADIYYSLKYIEPTMYFVNKIKGEKIGFSYRLTQNNFNRFFYQTIEYNTTSSSDDNRYTHEMLEPQMAFSHTFLINYEKPFKSSKYFMQMQMGFTVLKNLSGVKNEIYPLRYPPYSGYTIDDNYIVNFDSFILNITFGRKF